MITDSERRALLKAIRTNAAAQVRRLDYGIYEVPSATLPGITYIVCGVEMDGGDHTCTCPAGEHGRSCYHIAAVRLRRVQEEAKRAYRTAAQRREAAPVASPASPPPAVLAEVRRVLDGAQPYASTPAQVAAASSRLPRKEVALL